jgi:polyketide biosynthesis enoyl-CoA hydratase PksI
MSGSKTQLTFPEPGLAVLDMLDVEGKNSFDEGFVGELRAHFDMLTRDDSVKVMVLGGLPETFCSGASREILKRLAKGQFAPADIHLAKAMLDLPFPTISAMEGHATGGGFALGLCADLIVMARESRYGAGFMNMGFTPGMGVTRLLEHVLSPAVAHELMYTGEFRKGADFGGAAGVNYILPRKKVRAKAIDLAMRIADKPRVPLTILKKVLSMPRRTAFEESRTLEGLMHTVSFMQPNIGDMIDGDIAAGQRNTAMMTLPEDLLFDSSPPPSIRLRRRL